MAREADDDVVDDGAVDAPAVGVPGTVTAAVWILRIEALGLAAAGVVVLVKTATGRPEDLLGAVLQAVLAVGAAALIVLGARSLARLQPSARTPLLVLQLLALPVAYSLWFQGSGRPEYGAPIMIAALVTIFLLLAPPSREALDRVD